MRDAILALFRLGRVLIFREDTWTTKSWGVWADWSEQAQTRQAWATPHWTDATFLVEDGHVQGFVDWLVHEHPIFVAALARLQAQPSLELLFDEYTGGVVFDFLESVNVHPDLRERFHSLILEHLREFWTSLLPPPLRVR